VTLGWLLKETYDRARNTDPAHAAAAAAALIALDMATDDPAIRALASWTEGRAVLQLEGRPAAALPLLEQAIAFWRATGEPTHAATVEVTRLHALALLGRYDEAIADGLRARDTLLAHGEWLAAGTIEQNIGNIYHRRDQYREAEQFLRLARDRYAAVGDQQLLAQADTNIAIELMFQHRFAEAATLYDQALARATDAGLTTNQAAIEINLGNLAFLQGRYDRALDYLERARRRYAALQMAHELATVELELADAYLELNLVPEAAALYARIIPTFHDLEMRAEQAHALAYYGWAMALLGEPDDAYPLLWEATSLYEAEGNAVGAAIAALFEGLILHAHHDDAGALAATLRAIPPLERARTWSRLLFARWLQGDIERTRGNLHEARRILDQTLADAHQHVVPSVAYRTQTSLGLLAAAQGDTEEAEAIFERAAALVYVERARSRALLDMLGGATPARPQGRDAFETGLLAQLSTLRDELNWLYAQLNDPDGVDDEAATQWEAAIGEREQAVQEINRQLAQHGGSAGAVSAAFSAHDIARLQANLPPDTVLLEYFSLHDELAAFVIDRDAITVHRGLGDLDAVDGLVEQLRFQTDTLRNGVERVRPHLDLLARRARHYLAALYDTLLRPLEARLAARRLIVVPHRTLHYVPFHALFDGTHYVVEACEVCCVPSASVLQHCLHRPAFSSRRALLMGVADEQTPQVRDEIAALQPLFDDATTLLDDHATRDALLRYAPQMDVLHLACHGQFRPDNPLFSSLRLGDGYFTVYDAYALPGAGSLVTLSACETGVSAVAPGDELIGLARGFFSTGVPSLLVSLWTADDATTATLMQDFYAHLRDGARPAAALRAAQRAALAHAPHPFFWSPFVLLGRW
jgi:CHAT domain-containing protein